MKMAETPPLKVLLVEDSPEDADILRRVLEEIPFEIKCLRAVRVQEAMNLLSTEPIDIVLLDLSLPDSEGIETVSRFRSRMPDVPIVILTGQDDEALALKTLQHGAQDYLCKQHATFAVLSRVIRYAIERHHLMKELKLLALVDDLTGLNNRRGFLYLAEQELKIAHRTRKGFFLVYADVNGLKSVNDLHGHAAGDQLIIDAARILKGAFRDSDIVSRIGGDEFAILTPRTEHASATLLADRIRKRVSEHNSACGAAYNLSLSLGVATYDPRAPAALDDLLHEADYLMYQDKYVSKLGLAFLPSHFAITLGSAISLATGG